MVRRPGPYLSDDPALPVGRGGGAVVPRIWRAARGGASARAGVGAGAGMVREPAEPGFSRAERRASGGDLRGPRVALGVLECRRVTRGIGLPGQVSGGVRFTSLRCILLSARPTMLWPVSQRATACHTPDKWWSGRCASSCGRCRHASLAIIKRGWSSRNTDGGSVGHRPQRWGWREILNRTLSGGPTGAKRRSKLYLDGFLYNSP
jgi:hypothetical protein